MRPKGYEVAFEGPGVAGYAWSSFSSKAKAIDFARHVLGRYVENKSATVWTLEPITDRDQTRLPRGSIVYRVKRDGDRLVGSHFHVY